MLIKLECPNKATMNKQPSTYYLKEMPSPVGRLKLIASNQGLAAILWENDIPNRIKGLHATEHNTHPILLETERQLDEYFKGERSVFTLPLDQVGTPFQKKVWEALVNIPFGETRTYGELAEMMGDINLSRAVGGANHRNPVSIVVPCHRVLGSSGDLTGFAGGLDAKAYLLKLEGYTYTKKVKEGKKPSQQLKLL